MKKIIIYRTKFKKYKKCSIRKTEGQARFLATKLYANVKLPKNLLNIQLAS